VICSSSGCAKDKPEKVIRYSAVMIILLLHD
jgi:hypothetical protein